MNVCNIASIIIAVKRETADASTEPSLISWKIF